LALEALGTDQSERLAEAGLAACVHNRCKITLVQHGRFE